MPAYDEVRPIQPGELDAFLDLSASSFGEPIDPAERELDRDVVEPERCLAAFDGKDVVGTTTAFSFELMVPAGAVPAAGVTAVGVAPTHRRRGVLSALMAAQLQGVADAGREPVAALFASEPVIYGRFGYGTAAYGFSLTVPRTTARLLGPADPGRLRLLPAAEAQAELATVYDAASRDRPGYLRRTDQLWRMRLFDPESDRHGATPLLAVVHQDADGQPDGYALYATKVTWRDWRPDGEVMVRELVGTTAPAYAALWRYLLGLDLMDQIRVSVGVDDPALAMLADPRAAGPRRQDNLWVRLVDLPRALAARRYAAPVDVVLEVTDPLLASNGGRWQLTADETGASCERSTRRADLTLGVAELGAAYLGGTTLAALELAGRVVQHRPGALSVATTAFGWHRAPYCPQVF